MSDPFNWKPPPDSLWRRVKGVLVRKNIDKDNQKEDPVSIREESTREDPEDKGISGRT